MPMRVLICTFGTQGDVQPFVALAQCLLRRGHEVGVCTAEGFRGLVEAAGVRYLPMSNDLLQLVRDTMPQMSGPGEAYKMFRAMGGAQRSALHDQWTAAQHFEPSIIVYHPKSLGGYHIAERLGVPGVLALPLPFFTPTREFPIPFIGSWPLGGGANRLSYQLQRLTALIFGGMINDFRHQLDLSPIRRIDALLTDRAGRPVPVLYAFSRHVRPIPADYPVHAHVTGYWFLDQGDGWEPPSELDQFLTAGPPPVYVGFGSMGFGKGADRRYRAIVEAVRHSGVRAVIATGWSTAPLDVAGNDVLVIDQAPHEWLFPRVSSVVHHGGSGTTGAGLRAGRPTLICPVLGDQPFWGQQVHSLGAGPEPLPWRRLTASRLTDRLHRLTRQTTYQNTAARIGSLIARENGTAQAVTILESIHGNR
ncbi:MAG: glycosyltransferase [Friedmanniella sp.]